MEVGAFLGGVSLASTPYREAIGSRLVTIRDFLLLFFFIDLGSRIELGQIADQLGVAAVLSAFVLVVKPAVVMACSARCATASASPSDGARPGADQRVLPHPRRGRATARAHRGGDDLAADRRRAGDHRGLGLRVPVLGRLAARIRRRARRLRAPGPRPDGRRRPTCGPT